MFDMPRDGAQQEVAMTTPNDQTDVDTSELGDITDDEAKQLLAGDGGDDTDRNDDGQDRTDDADHLGDRGKRALDRIRNEKKAAEKRAAELEAELDKYRNANKSELERLQEERDKLRETSSKAMSEARALRVAMDRAPEHATLAQVRAVAKRVRGENDDELETDADELFELLAPKAGARTPQRPKERLKGGTAEPDEEPEETDPRKLAALLPRRR